MKNRIQTLSATLLAAALSCSAMPLQALAAEKDGETASSGTEKTETVYAFLNEDGDVSKTLVSSWIHNDSGISGIRENLDLEDVENVKTEEEPKVDGNSYTWSVKGNDVYYQGTTTKKLPVDVDIQYELDGKKVTAEQLNGKSGHLKTTFSFKNNESKQVTVNGKKVTIHPAFLAGGLINFDNEVFTDVTCRQGTLVNDGSREMMMFAAVPGLENTLDTAGLESIKERISLADDVVIEADVKNYAAPDIYIAMTDDFDIGDIEEISSISELTDGVKELSEAADELNEGSAQLADGTSQLKEGIAPLASAGTQMDALKSALAQLDDGAGSLKDGISTYTEGVDQLNSGIQSLDAITDGIAALKAAFGADGDLKKGTSQLAAGLKQLEGELDKTDPSQIAGLDQQIAGYKTQLDQLDQLIDKDLQTVQGLSKSLSDTSEALNSALTQFSGLLQNAAADLNQQVAAHNAVNEANRSALGTIQNSAAAANNELAAGRSQASAAIDQALAALDSAPEGVDVSSQKAALQNAKNSLGSTVVSVDGAFQDYSEFTSPDLSAAASLLEQLNTQVSTSMEQAQGVIAGLQSDLKTSEEALDQFSAEINAMLNSDLFKGLSGKMTAMKTAVSQLSAGADALDASVSQKLEPAAGQLLDQSRAGIDQLKKGSQTLADNSAALNEGAARLKSGTAQLNDTSVSLTALQAGLTTLESAVSQIDDGAHELHNGTQKFKDEGMTPLTEAVDTASEDLEAFEDLAKQIRDYTESYTSFAGAPEGADTKVRFIYKVEETENSED